MESSLSSHVEWPWNWVECYLHTSHVTCVTFLVQHLVSYMTTRSFYSNTNPSNIQTCTEQIVQQVYIACDQADFFQATK